MDRFDHLRLAFASEESGQVPEPEVVLSSGDATLGSYVRRFEELDLHLSMWDESEKVLRARGVSRLEDDGTWEVDAVVRLPDFDSSEGLGYGLVDTEGVLTLRFRARSIEA